MGEKRWMKEKKVESRVQGSGKEWRGYLGLNTFLPYPLLPFFFNFEESWVLKEEQIGLLIIFLLGSLFP